MLFKTEIIFVRLLFPFIIGILSFYAFQNQHWLKPLIIINLCLFTYLVGINSAYKFLKAYRFKSITGVFVYLFFFFLGGLFCLLNTQFISTNYFGNKNYNYLKVWVNDEPQQSKDILRFKAEVTAGYNKFTGKKTVGKLLVALKIDSLNPVKLNYGDELMIAANYLPVEPPYNPSEFNFKAWLASQNIYHQTFINQNNLVILNKNQGNTIIKYAINLRQKQVAIYRKLIKNDEAFAVASTLVLGYRADLSQETLAAYSKTGTIHALSVSGMHVGIIYIVLNWLLAFLNKKRSLKIIKLVIICGIIWFYALLTGFSPSVLRAAIMLSAFIVAKSFNKNSNSYNILAFTAFCLLLYNPFLIWDLGFQLSFIAVFGLVYLQPKIYNSIYIKNKWADKLWGIIALSLAAQIVTFPLSIYYFHQFPLYFIFSNLFILLPVILMMYLGIGILLLRVYFLAPVFEWIINFTNTGLKWITNLPFSSLTAIWIDKTELILLSLFLIFFVVAIANYQKKLLITALTLLLIFQSFVAYHNIKIKNQKKIVFFTLRKNYAAAFINANTAVLVTDLNPNDKNYQFFVKPALDQHQISKISYINFEKDTAVSNFNKKENQIKFYNYHILLMDKQLAYKKINNLPKFNALWLHQNPYLKINELNKTILFTTLIIDASNKDYNIRNYTVVAKKIKLKNNILKKNKAYLIDLNKL